MSVSCSFPMRQSRPPKPLQDLDARLRRARGNGRETAPENAGQAGAPMSGMGLAFHIVAELVVALIVGVGAGIMLDKWLETAPWFLVVFLFLGAGAGIFNVYRLVSGIGLAVGYRKPSNGTPSMKNENKDDAG